MHVEQVDFFYLAMPEVLDIGDGSQDALVVRVRAGGWEGWGECEASPLVSIASLVAPMSHSACKPVIESVLGQRVDSTSDIARIGATVRANSFDQLQSAHTWSGIDVALWDLLGKRNEVPVYELLGHRRNLPKVPYASTLFGDTSEETHATARLLASEGYRAVKFGWNGFGTGTLSDDVDQLAAAREGIGTDAELLIDAAMAWSDDPEPALARLPFLEEFGVLFIEEPFVSGAHAAYRRLGQTARQVQVAGGEGSHNRHMALNLMTEGAVGYIQIDTGRIGGISEAQIVADAARDLGCNYLNHTFTSHLALSASIQPYAGDDRSGMCEYPVTPRPVSWELTENHLVPDADGLISIPDAPGLGMTVDTETIRRYLVDTEIVVNGEVLYRSPEV